MTDTSANNVVAHCCYDPSVAEVEVAADESVTNSNGHANVVSVASLGTVVCGCGWTANASSPVGGELSVGSSGHSASKVVACVSILVSVVEICVCPFDTATSERSFGASWIGTGSLDLSDLVMVVARGVNSVSYNNFVPYGVAPSRDR